MTRLDTRFTRAFGVEHPVVSAPMAFAAGGRLAGAVSQAGGLGLIGGAYGDPGFVSRAFEDAGNAPVGCGLKVGCALNGHAAQRTVVSRIEDMGRPFVSSDRLPSRAPLNRLLRLRFPA